MTRQYKAPRGTQDILPADQPWWDYVRDTAARLAREFGYAQIETPVFEEAPLFTRGVGEVTDIVQKEMYVFQDRGGTDLALRPEGTAPVCRAYLEHGMHSLPQPVRLWYITPIFRYDRPQAGRYRQHHQFGVEAIGEAGAAVDAEVIELLWRLCGELGLTGQTLHLNSIGDQNCRPAYLEMLRGYYRDKLSGVCEDCRARFERNPLRLLDCKQEICRPVIAVAPPIADHLCDECARHFADLCSYLDAAGIPFALNPRLVRGLDYYTRTVFEVQPREEGGQSSLGGGGRYDGLIEQLGGKPTPGIGFGSGIERIVINLKRQEAPLPDARPLQVYVVVQTPAARVPAFRLASDLRRAGVSAVAGSSERSLKAQMRHADALGAVYAAILGERELAEGTVALKHLADGTQETVALAEVAERVGPA
ncbi:MAG: histidine--tRNA ligase [Dehalococcoidia bacterium]|nr:histidine--tRNA ligase [Dehalococcoidia bacterium]